MISGNAEAGDTGPCDYGSNKAQFVSKSKQRHEFRNMLSMSMLWFNTSNKEGVHFQFHFQIISRVIAPNPQERFQKSLGSVGSAGVSLPG